MDKLFESERIKLYLISSIENFYLKSSFIEPVPYQLMNGPTTIADIMSSWMDFIKRGGVFQDILFDKKELFQDLERLIFQFWFRSGSILKSFVLFITYIFRFFEDINLVIKNIICVYENIYKNNKKLIHSIYNQKHTQTHK